MKKIIYTMIIATMLTGCMTYQGFYNVGLQEVERPENAKERYGESKIVNFEEEGKTKYSYEDDMIKIVWLPLSTQFGFTLQNKTDHSIKIIWDEAVYVDQNGSSRRVIHKDIRYTDINNPETSSVVVKNATVDEMIVPADNIYSGYGGWKTKPMFPNSANSEKELSILAQQYIGKEVRVLLPLKIQETINEYIFTFKVESYLKSTSYQKN
jgi:hypothetical protein